MISPKALVLLCVIALPATTALAQGLSPEARKVAEEALRRRMEEAQGQPKINLPPTKESPAPVAPAAPAAPAPRTVTAPVPAPIPMQKAPSNAIPASSLSAAAEAKARALLDQKIRQDTAPRPISPPVTQPTPRTVVTAPPPTTPKPVRTYTAPPLAPSGNLPRNQVLIPPSGCAIWSRWRTGKTR